MIRHPHCVHLKALLLLAGTLGCLHGAMALAQDIAGPFIPPEPPKKESKALIGGSKTAKTKAKEGFASFFTPVAPKDRLETTRTDAVNQDPSLVPPKAKPKPLGSSADLLTPDEAAPTKKGGFINLPSPELPEVPDIVVSSDDPPLPVLKRVDDPKNPQGLMYNKALLERGERLIGLAQYAEAEKQLLPLKLWLVEATEQHIKLYKILTRVPSGRVQGEFEKRLALEFAKLRDRTLFALGDAYARGGQPRKAIVEWCDVLQSQSRTELGLQAYKRLQDVGFTEPLQFEPTPATNPANGVVVGP